MAPDRAFQRYALPADQPFFDADFILHTLTVFEVRKPL
jgi:hypothetical protein